MNGICMWTRVSSVPTECSRSLAAVGFSEMLVDLCLTDCRYPISMTHLELFVSNFLLIVRVRWGFMSDGLLHDLLSQDTLSSSVHMLVL